MFRIGWLTWFVVLAAVGVLYGRADAQTRPLVVEVTEPGFLAWDGALINDAQITSTRGATLVIEGGVSSDMWGEHSFYFVWGLTGEDIIVSAPGHESKRLRTAGQTRVDVWLARTGAYTPVPGGSVPFAAMSSPSPLAVTTFRDDRDVVLASHLYWPQYPIVVTRLATGRSVELPESTDVGVAIGEFNGRLHLAWTGLGNRNLNVMSSVDGFRWERKVTLPYTALSRPAIASFGKMLVLSWTDTEGRIRFVTSTDGTAWSQRRSLGDGCGVAFADDRSLDAPALRSFEGRLHLAWTGLDRVVRVASTDTTCAWRLTASSETSPYGPSLSVMNGTLVMTWAGTDARQSINTAEITRATTFVNKRTFPKGSHKTPMVLSAIGSTTKPIVAMPLFVYTPEGDFSVVARWPF